MGTSTLDYNIDIVLESIQDSSSFLVKAPIPDQVPMGNL